MVARVTCQEQFGMVIIFGAMLSHSDPPVSPGPTLQVPQEVMSTGERTVLIGVDKAAHVWVFLLSVCVCVCVCL